MKVKMIHLQLGPTGRRVPGEIYEVDDKLGKQLCEQGHAELVEEEPEETPEKDQKKKSSTKSKPKADNK